MTFKPGEKAIYYRTVEGKYISNFNDGESVTIIAKISHTSVQVINKEKKVRNVYPENLRKCLGSFCYED